MKEINSVSFLAIGKTQESKENQGFKYYEGVASSYVLAVNPTKQELEEIYGYEQKEPEYIREDANGKQAFITFIVRTDPDTNNGIEIINRAMFTLRPTPAYNKDNSKVQIIDEYGNFTWVNSEIAEKGGKIEHIQKIGKYRKAYIGECALVDFLKKYLNVPDAFDYKNGTWVKKSNGKDAEGIFYLEKINDYFKGDFSELKDALALQPNNKIKLLYGVRTNDEGKHFQVVCTREGMMLNNASGTNALLKLEKDLANAKSANAMSNVSVKVQELQEWDIKPSTFETTTEESDNSDEMPWSI